MTTPATHNAQTRPQAEFAEFFREHYGFALAFVRRIGTPPIAIEDVVQETFLTAYRKGDQFARHERAKPWLAAIARNCARNWSRGHRRMQRKHRAAVDDVSSPGSGETTDRLVRQSVVRRYLSGLTEEKLEALVFTVAFGMTSGEIAECTGVNVNTVRSRVAAAKGEVRRIARDLDRDAVPQIESEIDHLITDAFSPSHTQSNRAWFALAPGMGMGMFGIDGVDGHESLSNAPGEPPRDTDIKLEPATDEVARFAPGPTRTLTQTAAPLLGGLGLAAAAYIGFSGAHTDAASKAAPEPVSQSANLPEHPPELNSPVEEAAAVAVPLASQPPVGTPTPQDSTPLESPASKSRATKVRKPATSESELLRSALTLERRGAYAKALAVAREHRRSFPNGELASVAAGVHIRALCGLRRASSAENQASRYVKMPNMASAVELALTSPICRNVLTGSR